MPPPAGWYPIVKMSTHVLDRPDIHFGECVRISLLCLRHVVFARRRINPCALIYTLCSPTISRLLTSFANPICTLIVNRSVYFACWGEFYKKFHNFQVSRTIDHSSIGFTTGVASFCHANHVATGIQLPSSCTFTRLHAAESGTPAEFRRFVHSARWGQRLFMSRR